MSTNSHPTPERIMGFAWGYSLPLVIEAAVRHRVFDTFTFAEMSEWLCAAGFANPRLLEVPSVSPLVLADKP